MTTKLWIPALALAVACGGPSKTSKKGMSKLAADAPPPPSSVKPGHKIDREVSREAEKDFAAAVAHYKEMEKAGWTQENCVSAAQRFQQVASDYDKMVEARYNAGLAFHNCNMLKEAEAEYQKALRINPGHDPSLTALGEIYYAGGNDGRGEEYWRKAVQANPKTTAARNNLAWVLLNKMRAASGNRSAWSKYEQEATGNLSRVLAVDNDNIEAYVLYALVYMEGFERNKSRLDLANLLLTEGAKRNDGYAPLWNARGLLELHKENVGRALSNFERAVQIDPKFVEARMNVGNIVLGFRKYDYAKQMFEAVLEMQPKNYDAIVGLGIAQRGLGQLDAAEATYEQARKLDPSRAPAYYNLGLLFKDFYASRAQNEAEAIAAYKKAKTYFTQFLSKADASKSDKKDAEDHIDDCDKAIAQLEEAQRMRQEMERQQREMEQQQNATPPAGGQGAPEPPK